MPLIRSVNLQQMNLNKALWVKSWLTLKSITYY